MGVEYDKDVLFKEIDLIQSCISRMSNNSFLVKGWLVAILVSALGFLKEDITWLFGSALIAAIVGLWALDSHYLYIERKYRWKYEWLIENRINGNEDHLFDLNPDQREMRDPPHRDAKDLLELIRVMRSWSVIYYLVSIAIIAIVMCGNA